jgi:DNA polymerase-3 subunit gamma/tau
MSYLVLARKYRPQAFEEVVGQQHVTRTLANAIENDRVAHALLFAGPRGTGKTTVARILAKAMNCEKGPTPRPCNRCSSCTEITAGNAVDVFEIDGASNNSVDQVRELRENVRYMPARSRFKIYIIDEVHMLSIAAFNALLKTLEEPPAHVMFMFATTEAHKIPVTILSRCQRYDFRRIALTSVVEHLKKLCALENFTSDEQGLWRIAQESGGSMRDALSLLDQVMACSDGEAGHDEVMEILGVIDRRVLFDISAAVFGNDLPAVLTAIDEVYDRGHEMDRFFADLVEHFRNLMVVKMTGEVAKLVDLPASEIEQMKKQAAAMPVEALKRIFDLLLREAAAVKLSMQPRLSLEMAFVRILKTPPALPIDVLIEKIDRLQQRFQPEDRHAETAVPTAGAEMQTCSEQYGAADTAPPEAVVEVRERPTARPRAEEPAAEAVPHPPADPQDVWEQIVALVSRKSPALASSLDKCRLNRLTENRLEIRVAGNGYHLNMLKREKHLNLIRETCRQVLGRVPSIDVTGDDAGPEPRRQRTAELHRLKQETASHPRVMDALEIFKGRIVDVKILQEETR